MPEQNYQFAFSWQKTVRASLTPVHLLLTELSLALLSLSPPPPMLHTNPVFYPVTAENFTQVTTCSEMLISGENPGWKSQKKAVTVLCRDRAAVPLTQALCRQVTFHSFPSKTPLHCIKPQVALLPPRVFYHTVNISGTLSVFAWHIKRGVASVHSWHEIHQPLLSQRQLKKQRIL